MGADFEVEKSVRFVAMLSFHISHFPNKFFTIIITNDGIKSRKCFEKKKNKYFVE